jgi:hypothetical protein
MKPGLTDHNYFVRVCVCVCVCVRVCTELKERKSLINCSTWDDVVFEAIN